MSDLSPASDAVQRARHINRLCDQFEAAWDDESRPSIESFLSQAHAEDRDELLRELIGLELAFRRRAGERPELSEYRRRFVGHSDAVAAATVGDETLVQMRSGHVGDQTTLVDNYGQAGPSEDELDQLLGRTIASRYEITERLGTGGMGSVYKAKQNPLDRWVALKVIRRDLARDPLAIKRFHREMRAAVRIQHPNTVRVYDYGTAESGELFLVMEYLDGQSLSSLLCHHQALDPGRIDHIGLQIAKALAAAHTEGIVHRDLKPQNIVLLDHYGDRDFVKVLDFGLARFTEQLSGDDSLTLTSDYGLLGTPHYMSPEQISGELVDHRADLYALGVLLFRLATGHEPFTAKTAPAILAKHLHDTPPLASAVAKNPIPQWLDRLIQRLLEKDPAQRPQSADEVIQQFDRTRLKIAAPLNEAERLAALRQLRILDTAPEQAFDDLAALASYICGTPIAAISLVDEDRQWFKSKVGMNGSETSRNISFCAHTILGSDLFMVDDATQDERFVESPLVTNNPQVRFYAGMPLSTSDGHNIGALCVMDREPRHLTPEQVNALAALTRLVISQLELRRAVLPGQSP